jgi:NAD+ synthase
LFFNCIQFVGDGEVDLSPIADLMDSELRAIAMVLGVGEDIIKAPPSDDDPIGTSDDELVWAVHHLKRLHLQQDENTLTDRQRQVFDIFIKRHSANLHKMVGIPRCIIPPELKAKQP